MIKQNDWTTFSISDFPPSRMISAVLGLLTNPKEVKSCRTASLKFFAQFLSQQADDSPSMDDARSFLCRWLPSALCDLLATPSLIAARSLKFVTMCFRSQHLPFPVVNLIRIRSLAVKSNAEKEALEVQDAIDNIFCSLLTLDSGFTRQANLISITAAVLDQTQLYLSWKAIFLSCCAALPNLLEATSTSCVESLKNPHSALNVESSITMLGSKGKPLHPSMISPRKQMHANLGLLQLIASNQKQLSEYCDLFFDLLRGRLNVVKAISVADSAAADPDDIEDINQLSALLCQLSLTKATKEKIEPYLAILV